MGVEPLPLPEEVGLTATQYGDDTRLRIVHQDGTESWISVQPGRDSIVLAIIGVRAIAERIEEATHSDPYHNRHHHG